MHEPFQDLARELDHPTLIKKVLDALTPAPNDEQNAGHLKTDWKLAWRPGKK